jgi:hypothetical protein
MLKRLQRLGVRRGLGGAGKGWLYVGIASWGLRTLQRMASRQPEIILSEEIKPGQRIIIANDRATVDVGAASDAKGRRGGRKGRRASRSAG